MLKSKKLLVSYSLECQSQLPWLVCQIVHVKRGRAMEFQNEQGFTSICKPRRHALVLMVVFIRTYVLSSQYIPFVTFTYSKVESIHGSQSACGLCASAGWEPGRRQVGDQMTSERVGLS